MIKVNFACWNKTVEVKSGTSLLDAALDSDLPLEHACGGMCACTTCQLVIVKGAENVSKMEPEELERIEFKVGPISEQDPSRPVRLGCQTKVLGEVTVDLLKS